MSCLWDVFANSSAAVEIGADMEDNDGSSFRSA